MSGTQGSVDPQKTSDHYDLDDGDGTYPVYLDYVVPAQASGIIKVTLSWKRRSFRSTANLNPSSIGSGGGSGTGGASVDHTHASAAHTHTVPVADNVTQTVLVSASTGAFSAPFGTGASNFASNSTTPGATGGRSADHTHAEGAHTHPLTGSASQAITEGAVSTVSSISFDGIDQTTALGGPWTGDMVELDISSVFLKSAGVWHTIALQQAGLGRLVSMLRIYYTT